MCYERRVESWSGDFGEPKTRLVLGAVDNLPYGSWGQLGEVKNWPSTARIVFPLLYGAASLEAAIPLEYYWWHEPSTQPPPYIVVEVSPPLIQRKYVIPERVTVCIDSGEVDMCVGGDKAGSCCTIDMRHGSYYGASPWSMYRRGHHLGLMRAVWFRVRGRIGDIHVVKLRYEYAGEDKCSTYTYASGYGLEAVNTRTPVVGGVANIAGAYIRTLVCGMSFRSAKFCPDYSGSVPLAVASPNAVVSGVVNGVTVESAGGVEIPVSKLHRFIGRDDVVEEADKYRLRLNASLAVSKYAGIELVFPEKIEEREVDVCGVFKETMWTRHRAGLFCCYRRRLVEHLLLKPVISIAARRIGVDRVCPGQRVPVTAVLNVKQCVAKGVRLRIGPVATNRVDLKPGTTSLSAEFTAHDEWWGSSLGPATKQLDLVVDRDRYGIEESILGSGTVKAASEKITLRLARLPTPELVELHIPSAARPGYPVPVTMIWRNAGECRGKMRGRAVDNAGKLWFDQTYSLDPGDTATLNASPEMVGYDASLVLSIDCLLPSGWRTLLSRRIQVMMVDTVALYTVGGKLIVRAKEDTEITLALVGEDIRADPELSLESVVIPLLGKALVAHTTIRPGKELVVGFGRLDALRAELGRGVSYVLNGRVVDRDTKTVEYSTNPAAAALASAAIVAAKKKL